MNKHIIYNSVDNLSPILIAFSDKIWELAELSMREMESAKTYTQILRSQGFTVEENLCNISTAF